MHRERCRQLKLRNNSGIKPTSLKGMYVMLKSVINKIVEWLIPLKLRIGQVATKFFNIITTSSGFWRRSCPKLLAENMTLLQ